MPRHPAEGAWSTGGGPSPREADLFEPLEEVVQRLDEGDAAAAVPFLRAFLRRVETLEGVGTLVPGDGEALAEAAAHLIERLEAAVQASDPDAGARGK